MEKELYAIKSSLEYGVQDTLSNLDYFTWKVKEGVMNLNYSLKKFKEDFKEEAYNVGKRFLDNFDIEIPNYENYKNQCALKKRKNHLDSLDDFEKSYLNYKIRLDEKREKLQEPFNEADYEDRTIVWAKNFYKKATEKVKEFKESDFYVKNSRELRGIYNECYVRADIFLDKFTKVRRWFGKLFKGKK